MYRWKDLNKTSVTIAKGTTDQDLDLIGDALEEYQRQHPSAEITLYRQNAVSIRIKVVDPDFIHTSEFGRHAHVWIFFGNLPEELPSDISMLVLLTLDEVATSIGNLEFDHPTPSVIP